MPKLKSNPEGALDTIRSLLQSDHIIIEKLIRKQDSIGYIVGSVP